MASVDVAAMASGAAGSTTTHPYTCNTCAVAYRNIDLQRGHMKSDWHRYNLKRRIASLPPISSEIFNDKVLQARAAQSAEAEKAYFERACDVCQRTYNSENAYQNHLSSQKHKLRQAMTSRKKDGIPDDASSMISSTFSLGDPISADHGVGEVDSDAEEEFSQVVKGIQKTSLAERPSPVKRPSNPRLSAQGDRDGDHPITDSSSNHASSSTTPVASTSGFAWTIKSCLFCNYNSPTVALNAHHMERFHGMFIPEKKYLVDLDGLLKMLQERVHEGHQCLYCGKMKSNAFAVQTHMRDKGHCKLPYSTEEEQLDIGDFYDFRSTYSDGAESENESMEDDGVANGGAKLGAQRGAKVFDEEGREVGDGEEDGWETDSSASSLDSADLTAVPAEAHYHQYERLDKHPHHSHTNPRAHHQADGWHSHAHKHNHAAFYDDFELHLPNGKSVGHRAYNKYYRQNLHHYPSAEERAERLAIEAARSDDEDAMQVDGEGNGQVARTDRNHVRAVVRRDAAGMAGVTESKKRAVQKAEARGRTVATQHQKKKDWAYSKALNNQKTFYYRYQAGG